MDALNIIISSSLHFSAPKLHTHDHAAILYTFVTLTTPTHQGAFNSHGSLPEREALQGKRTVFLCPFLQRRKEMAHPAPTKGFSRPSQEAAMLPRPSAKTHPLLPCKGGEKWPTQLQPRAFQGQAQKRPCYLGRVLNPPTSPCPALSTGAEPKSQGHCRKCDITDEVSCRL